MNEEIEERLDALERGKAAEHRHLGFDLLCFGTTLPFWEKCRNRKNRIIEVSRRPYRFLTALSSWVEQVASKSL